MIITQEHTGNIKIEDYGFAEWLAQVEQVINQGYKFDFVDNANYPVGYGSMYTAVLVPVVSEVASEVETEDAPEVQTPETTPVETPVQTKRKNAKA